MKDKTILDCESVETTYNSLERILGVTRQSMEKVFQDFDIDRYYTLNPNSYDRPNELLLSKVLSSDQLDIEFDCVCWFHLTRTVQTNKFEEGILPLNKAINLIWDFLYALVDQELDLNEWNKLKLDYMASPPLNSAFSKLIGEPTYGPYAVLVREGAFRWRELSNHDYLGVPEAVEDFSYPFEKRYKIDLLRRFKENTRPCIVKFIDDRVYPGLIGCALYYLYTVYRGFKFSHLCTTNFCGQNEVIGKNRILKIEFPDILEE